MYVMSPKGHSKHDSHVHHQGTKRRCNATILRQLDCLLSPLLKQCVGGQTCWWNPSQLSWIQLYPPNWQMPNCKIEVSKPQTSCTFEMQTNVTNFIPFLTRKVGYPRFFPLVFVHGVSTGSMAEALQMLWFTLSKSTILRHKWRKIRFSTILWVSTPSHLAQIIICHRPRFPWKKEISLTNHYFWWGRVRSLGFDQIHWS